jgi:mono/diheme cytochrome c family protein
MAEKKTVGHAYNIDFLNVVFAVSSILLFVSTVWMVWDDYDREWKNAQRRFRQLEIEVTEASRQQAMRAIDRNKLTALEAARAAGTKEVAANQAKIDEIRDRLAAADARVYRTTQDYQFAKASYDVERYDYEVARERRSARAEAGGRQVAARFAEVTELNAQMEKATAERDAIQAELAKITGRLSDAEKQLTELRTEESRLARRLETLAPSFTKTFVRDAPLLDFMAPTIRVQQVITPNILDDVNFTRVPKMDRCMTCHLAIDKKGYEKYPQPFRTHSNLAAYVGPDSPHPLERTGCTVCHEGMGQSVSFRDASHMPATDEDRERWEEEHGWEEPHFWDYPMLPAGMTEASCAKCHKGEIFVPEASRLGRAYSMYERAGCYACHKTRGFENLRKPGPSLVRIDAKLTPDWVQTWIRNPRAVKATTWMPRIWHNSNTSSPADFQRSEAEIDATVAYLFANTDTHVFPVPSPPRGDAARGKRTLETVGCLGCHVADNTPRDAAGPRRTFGQPLQSIGSKTTYVWLFNWIRDPGHFTPGTYMPDLRLTDEQVADVATYLTTLTGASGDAPKAAVDSKVAEAALLDYLKATMTVEQASQTVAGMDARTRRLELGRRAIGRYGCFSCHEIKGFEKTQPIGIELSEEGSKLITQLDFAFTGIRHNKVSWFTQKLHDPRSFDRGRELLPLDKLRMPNFDLSDEEVRLFVTAIMSFQRDVQPAQALRPRSARADDLIAGRNFVRRRNCVACHEIEGDGGDYKTLLADASLAPPLLTPEGAKVQPDWLYAFLRGPITIRPWLDVRMPTFGLDDASWNEAIRYFAAISGSVGPFRTHETVRASDSTGWGSELFTLLKCQQCHVLGAIPKDQPTANLAPDLRMAPDRLQPDWILDWLKNPARIQPGTRMPAFWPDFPKSYYPQLGGDGERQIRAIRDHLLTFRGGPSPRRTAALTAPVALP